MGRNVMLQVVSAAHHRVILLSSPAFLQCESPCPQISDQQPKEHTTNPYLGSQQYECASPFKARPEEEKSEGGAKHHRNHANCQKRRSQPKEHMFHSQ